MQLTPFNVYLWQQMDAISATLFCITLAFSVFSAIALFASYVDNTGWQKFFTKILATSLFLFIGSNLIPSSRTIAMMYVIPSVAESKIIQEDAPEVYNMAVDALKNWIKDNSLAEK